MMRRLVAASRPVGLLLLMGGGGGGGRGAARRGGPALLLVATTTLRPSTTRDSRTYASAGAPDGLAQQVIDYARALVADEEKKEQQQQQQQHGDAAVANARRRALDALRSVAPALAGGAPRCAVLLAASDAHACLGEWAEASKEAAEALEVAVAAASADSAAADPASRSLLPTAALAAVRAALAAGDDAAAAEAAARAGPGEAGLAELAALAAAGAAAGGEREAQPSDDASSPLALLSLGRAHAAAAMRAAAAASQDGGDGKAAAAAAAPHADAARGPLEKCAELAEKEADSASFTVPLIPHLSASLWREVAADARVAQGQAAAAARRWPEAEEALSAAVKSGEAAAGGDARAPSLAGPLVLLGDVYARTARVTFAEGMYREAARLARAEAQIGGRGGGGGGGGRGGGGVGGSSGGGDASGDNSGEFASSTDGSESGSPAPARAGAGGPWLVHPSVGALAAWRHAQLLTALPRRETEARAWAAAGGRLWRRAGFFEKGESSPASFLGALDCRTGRSQSREGGSVSLLCRRLFVVEGA